MTDRTFEEAMEEGRRLLPDALRAIAERLESDDMVESTVLCQAADELERDPWQPIETAPKTRKSILVWCPAYRNIYLVTWVVPLTKENPPVPDPSNGFWAHFGGGLPLRENPTRWMYPPKGPKS